jgi:hypothetical protein
MAINIVGVAIRGDLQLFGSHLVDAQEEAVERFFKGVVIRGGTVALSLLVPCCDGTVQGHFLFEDIDQLKILSGGEFPMLLDMRLNEITESFHREHLDISSVITEAEVGCEESFRQRPPWSIVSTKVPSDKLCNLDDREFGHPCSLRLQGVGVVDVNEDLIPNALLRLAGNYLRRRVIIIPAGRVLMELSCLRVTNDPLLIHIEDVERCLESYG